LKPQHTVDGGERQLLGYSICPARVRSIGTRLPPVKREI
jgi:hypothetical protein